MEDVEATVTRHDGQAAVLVWVPDSDDRAEVLWRAAARLCREAGEIGAATRAESPAASEAWIAARYSMLQTRGDVVTAPDAAQAAETCVGCDRVGGRFVLVGAERLCDVCAPQEVAS